LRREKAIKRGQKLPAAKAGRPRMSDDSADSRTRLIEVATRLFATHGYEGVSVRDIAAEAGLNLSMVSYYFGGKDGLLEACLQESGQKQLDLAVSLLTPVATAKEFLATGLVFVEKYLESRVADIALVRLANAEMEKNSPVFDRLVKTIFVRTLAVMTEFFRGAHQKGIIPRDLDPQELAGMLHGQMNFHLRTSHVRKVLTGNSLEDEQTRKIVARHIYALFFEGICK
jgi:TetR/AcrR family transcriptional regulator